METVQEYQLQLKVIENALKTTAPGPERDELLSLKENIEELLLLTTETANILKRDTEVAQTDISSSQNTSTPAPSQKDTNNDGASTDEEWSQFMSEMEQEGAIETQGVTIKDNEEYSEEDYKKIKELEGQKCQAPYKQTWGQMSYHNAMICSVPNGASSGQNLQVKVLFLNPTHQEMLPCPYYFDLKKDCHYDEDSCRYSHGHLINHSELKTYIEPKFDNLTIGSNVIAKQADQIWYKGKISRITQGKCFVKFESKSSNRNSNIEEVSLEHVLPMDQNDPDSDSDDCQIIEDAEANQTEKRRQDLVNQSLMITPDSKPLGDWEKHTKGIGSKLMQKMGYIVGTGLGKNGAGIIKPVTALILPQGKSLDFCMNLKEQTQNPNLFHAENKTMKPQKKQSKKQLRKEKRRFRLETFSLEKYIDFSLTHKRQEALIPAAETKVIQEKLKNESDKNVNLCLFKLDETLKKSKKKLMTAENNIVSMEQIHKVVPKGLYNKQKSQKNTIDRAELMKGIIKNELDRRKNNRDMSVF